MLDLLRNVSFIVFLPLMKNIQHIIFDLGEVIINIDRQAVRNQMLNKGVENIDEIHQILSEKNVYFDFETGAISEEQFRGAIREATGIPLTDQEIDDTWNAMLLDIPKERVRFMTKLKSRYKLYLLSNTNSIHWRAYDQGFQDAYDYPGINTFFTHAWYSFLMGVRKPDPEIFRMVLQEGCFEAGEVAFIDDLKENTDAARSVGIHGIHLAPGMEIMDLFDDSLSLIATK